MNGEDIGTCPSCSLRIRIIYDEVGVELCLLHHSVFVLINYNVTLGRLL